MELKDYTTEELKAELKRRAVEEEKKKIEERANAKVCRNCKHFCTIDHYGHTIDPASVKPWSAHCCPFAPFKNNPQRFRVLTETHTCEHFDKKS